MITSGVHSIVPMHTTHKHIEGFEWPLKQSLRDAWLYASGQSKPNYHTPAIRYEVAWYVNVSELFIWELSDEDDMNTQDKCVFHFGTKGASK